MLNWFIVEELKLFLPSAIRGSAHFLSGFLVANGISDALAGRFSEDYKTIALALLPSLLALISSYLEKKGIVADKANAAF